MPAIVAGSPQPEEPIWKSLKRHIMRERQQKKQEKEQDEEEERQRKERETQQKNTVMTIEETKEQIATLESELTNLKHEKHELFVQLKKVLHEDDSRRRLIKETSVMQEPHQQVTYLDHNTIVNPHLYLPLPRGAPLYQVKQTTPSHQMISNGNLKRTHSPSPPPQPTVSSYHPGYGYKPPPIPYSIPGPPKAEDARRSGDSRVVLWNKTPNQFPGSSYYSATPQYDFGPPPTSQTLTRVAEPGKSVYLTAARPPMPTLTSSPYPEEPKFYPRASGPVPVHGNSMPMPHAPQGQKGSITSGYPVRTPQPPQSPYPPPPGAYVSVTGAPNVPGRLLYTQPSQRYLQRD
ncbi:leucine-rich repeat extensin-like protein 1 [Trichogramma pretiosum]|uniref:leucine-rich repeat extensin-like protein 1 n=1 Tax=Trichogramma pretiosum TaxID=7493 RepID=UPI0006C9B669|nr:leucine-rich repeat extensin-like protein 1 [Trichogramma pretiosum]